MRRFPVLGLVVLFLALPPGSDVSEAYRLASRIFSGSGTVLVPTTTDLRHWGQDKWAAGAELEFWVSNDPDWDVRFDSPEQAVPYVERAVAFWSEIEGADMRLRVAGLHDGLELGSDERNVISVGRDGTYAAVEIFSVGDDIWMASGCDIRLDAQHVEIRNDYPDTDRDDRRDGALIHEIGHCLGIDHAAQSPIVLATLSWSGSSVWREDPRMSYGVHRGQPLLADDRVAALLTRPLPGWIEATGSIGGKLTLSGAPARFVVVDVLRSDGEHVRPAASVFSNQRGEFLAEGLTPGHYFLWIHPLKNSAANGDLARQTPTDIDDLVALQPIVVRAGEVSGGHDFALRRGRNVR